MAVEPYSLPETETIKIHSKDIGQDFQLSIAQPAKGLFQAHSGPPRVLYVLDANLFFATVVEMSRLMHQFYGEIPPVLVVGIGYPTSDQRLIGELRTRDFTPTKDEGFASRMGSMGSTFQPTLPEEQRMGGGSLFLRFLEESVVSFIRNKYETEGNGILFGSSLGGLFASHALLTTQELFDGFVIASPALWWNNESLFEVEESYAQHNEDLKAEVYFAVGQLEESANIPMLAPFKMVTNTQRMSERLSSRNYPSLGLHSSVLECETHTTVLPVALTRGLRALLAQKR